MFPNLALNIKCSLNADLKKGKRNMNVKGEYNRHGIFSALFYADLSLTDLFYLIWYTCLQFFHA